MRQRGETAANRRGSAARRAIDSPVRDAGMIVVCVEAIAEVATASSTTQSQPPSASVASSARTASSSSALPASQSVPAKETTNPRTAPGRAAVLSTVVLLLTYLAVAAAVVSFAGTEWLAENADEEEAVFALLSGEALGGWDWVVLLAVATSAIASTQTTIIPASRTALSMARRAALPRRFASVSPRYRTPDVSTWWVAAVAVAWYVGVALVSENALFDSITALSLLIALYYALTGIACAVWFRRRLSRSAKDLLLLGVGPLVGAGMLLWLLVLSVRDLADPANSYTGAAWLGVGPPLVIGVGILLAGIVLMLWWRTRDAAFWRERSSVDPG